LFPAQYAFTCIVTFHFGEDQLQTFAFSGLSAAVGVLALFVGGQPIYSEFHLGEELTCGEIGLLLGLWGHVEQGDDLVEDLIVGGGCFWFVLFSVDGFKEVEGA
jgi:hypothetical protein